MGLLEDVALKLDTLLAETVALKTEIAALHDRVMPDREIFTLRNIAALPGSPSLKTLRNCPDRQPKHGQPDGYAGREKAWRRETVEAWRGKILRTPARAAR
jgi:hypothetical protein